jgi:hypothetical protein
MKITRVYSDSAGESHFEDIEVSLSDSGQIGWLSEEIPANGIIFRENDADYNYDWHNAPQKQYVIMLDGEIEIQTSDGNKRIFHGGDVFLVEDVTGKGHKARITNNKPRKSIFITLP